MNGLDPKFIAALLGLLTQPSCQTEIWLTVMFPQIKAEFDDWMRGHVISAPTGADVYDWLQKRFPKAPLRSPDQNPDDSFRALLKAIIAQAFNLDYVDAPKLDLSQIAKLN